MQATKLHQPGVSNPNPTQSEFQIIQPHLQKKKINKVTLLPGLNFRKHEKSLNLFAVVRLTKNSNQVFIEPKSVLNNFSPDYVSPTRSVNLLYSNYRYFKSISSITMYF